MRFPIIILAVLVAACSPTRDPVVVTFDDIASRPEEFSGREVIVEGVLAMGFESMVFQHPDDPIQESDIWWEYGVFPKEEASARGFDLLRDALVKAPNIGGWNTERMLRVRVEGSFAHAEQKGAGFGHLGHYSSQIVITRVIEAEPCKKAAEPGATDNPDDAQRLREDH